MLLHITLPTNTYKTFCVYRQKNLNNKMVTMLKYVLHVIQYKERNLDYSLQLAQTNYSSLSCHTRASFSFLFRKKRPKWVSGWRGTPPEIG